MHSRLIGTTWQYTSNATLQAEAEAFAFVTFEEPNTFLKLVPYNAVNRDKISIRQISLYCCD
jgi:hypothetical protein